jgi:hypothetical protein
LVVGIVVVAVVVTVVVVVPVVPVAIGPVTPLPWMKEVVSIIFWDVGPWYVTVTLCGITADGITNVFPTAQGVLVTAHDEVSVVPSSDLR